MNNKNFKQINKNEVKELGEFNTMPSFAFLWDRCVYEMLYNPNLFVDEFCKALSERGINKNSEILDVSAGSGFPTIDMYKLKYSNITCVDGSDDQIELFNNKAQEAGLEIKSKKCLFDNLSSIFKPESFDALICKGTIWYAGGGWNQDYKPSREDSLGVIKSTIKIFYSLLKSGGVLYVDKFKDDETDHKDTVGTFKVSGHNKELIFYTHREIENNIRRATMLTKDVETGVENGLPNVTYDLKESELEEILKEVGFSIEKLDLSEEKTFRVWLAKK